jgi:hypothetical protein
MPQPQIPEVLKKRLVFGDAQQINALRDYERKIEEYLGGEGEKRWAVHIEVEGTITVHVTAKNREEAEEKARDEADFDMGDFDVCYNAVEVRAKAQ